MPILTACIVVGLSCQPANIRIIDGDTLDIGGERIRLSRIDAAEMFHPRCPDEAMFGFYAKSYLTIALDGARIGVTRHGRDRYGRTLADLTTEAGDVGDALEALGLAIDWRPGREAWEERREHWCGEEKR